MTMDEPPFASARGFSICTGMIDGVVHVSSSPYSGVEEVSAETILVLDYPAMTFSRLLHRAGGVIAGRGTSHVETAKFLEASRRPRRRTRA